MACEWTVRVSGYLDDELEPPERLSFEAHLRGCDECTQELEALRSMHQVTRSMKLKEFPDEVWDRFWDDTYNRLERNVGWILLSAGAIVLLAFGVYELLLHLLDDSIGPWWIRAATGLVCLGIATLFVSVVRERIFVRSNDPYREVKR